MAPNVRLLSSAHLAAGIRPDSSNPSYTGPVLSAFAKMGTSDYMRNVVTQFYGVEVDGYWLPISVNEAQYDNSYVVSPYSVVAYTQEELRRFHHPVMTPLLMPLLRGVGGVLQWQQMNRVVIVNNWLLSTNLYPSLTEEQIVAVNHLLQDSFPGYTLLWRSLNGRSPEGLLDRFGRLKGRLLASRQIYFYDPRETHRLSSKARWNIKNDARLIAKQGYEIVDHSALQLSDLFRIRELYDQLYLEKYSHYNPQLTEPFLKLAIESGFFTVRGLKKEGRLDGVMGYFVRDGVMTTPLVGYDTSLPAQVGLYRMVTALCIQESHRHGLLLHHSSGASHFKRVRGMRPEMEFTAVFNPSGVPLGRRLLWGTLHGLFNGVGAPLLRRFKL